MEELQIIQNKIYEVRGQKVMLDRDLAELYGVETKALNQAVKRNIERFPERFMFQLTKEECSRSQFVTLNDSTDNQVVENLRSQFVTSSLTSVDETFNNYGGRRYLPYVFTEQGVSMLSAVLKSSTAVKVCITIMDAFVTLRNQVVDSGVGAAEVERRYGEQLEALEKKFDKQLRALKFELTGQLASMDRQYCSLLDRQLVWESQHPGVDRFAPPLYLAMATWVDEYSPKALVIFTVTKDDRFLLKSIGARFNPWLNWQGQKRAGWIFPKSQVSKLIEILPQGYDLEILKRACGDVEYGDKICRARKK